MDEFLEQFLIESRENVEQATADLLALESDPSDRPRLDSAFRCFHTLKGGAGIVEFPAMAEAMHAAEEVLAEVRAGGRAVTAAVIGDCLACLDQVVQWLDVIESSGALPPAPQSRALVARLARAMDPEPSSAASRSASDVEDWIEDLLERHPHVRVHVATAFRYKPVSACFFEGVDPIARIAAVPGLLALEVEPVAPWPVLEALDPFACNVALAALCGTPSVDVVAALADIADDCEIHSIVTKKHRAAGAQLPELARAILNAQIALIAGSDEMTDAGGRLASAGIVAANVLRHAGRSDDANRIASATERALAGKSASPLREALHGVVAATAQAADGPLASTQEDFSARTLRVDATRIDALVKLAGELTVAKNALAHTAKIAQESSNPLAALLKEKNAVLDRLVAELQQSVLALRVRPLQSVFQRFPRLVREMSLELGKPASLVIAGGETEADKTIVEVLFEPLLHVLRNAMDHGVENAAKRATRGKSPTATVTLRAFRQDQHVVVEVSDDGAGIDLARIREVALQRDLVTPEKLSVMPDNELIDLIFAPGFSTALAVTGTSGRGVGMDSVRSAVRRIGGRVDIATQAGQGTVVRFELPFSVMMTRVMIVGVGEQRFGIALDAVVENLRVSVERIVPVGASNAIVIRNQTVPLIELAAALGLQCGEEPRAEATVVLTRIAAGLGALRVDRIEESMEVILTPLEGLLAGMRGIAGSTLLGDGTVLVVLNLEEIFV